MNRDTLLETLKEKYPKAWFKTSEGFDGTPGGIWTGEGSEVIVKYSGDSFEVPIFEYYEEPFGASSYENGVYKPFAKFLAKHGWVCEFYDPGTVMIWKEC